MLSTLLWAGFGVNRAEGPFGQPWRTAASASNSQEIDFYVALEDGAYFHDGLKHQQLVAEGDHRKLCMTPRHGVLPDAPVHFIYVADLDKLTHTKGFEEPGLHDTEVQKSYYFVDSGLIAGNVYLFSSANNLACWFHNCDKKGLAKVLNFRSGFQLPLFAQLVGYHVDPKL